MPRAVLVGLLLLVQMTPPSDEDPMVKTIHSDLRGLYMDVEGNRVSAFLGVPFAMPPTGSRRFAKPTPITEYQAVVSELYNVYAPRDLRQLGPCNCVSDLRLPTYLEAPCAVSRLDDASHSEPPSLHTSLCDANRMFVLLA
ncbi:unnamed protein product [Nippostrongylus brasiliensis]|uniref:COesterase domain-containing protein n=1 Tax=Nippostrongylus brasiliensis TaxID=27835 RepID=A0A0N4YFH4_NIPBR|nr:unnamed protein product [Nippostrongylus brasiliensis]